MTWLAASYRIQVKRLGRWRRRNGLIAPPFAWPGIVHQGWGWFDALSNAEAAGFAAGLVVFLLATAMYLLGASALPR